MTSIVDLQAALDEHASLLVDEHLPGRAVAVRRQGRLIRRRRIVATVAAAAVVVPIVGAAMLGVNPLRQSAPVVGGPDPEPGVVAGFAGRTLLDSESVTDGSELTLTYDATSQTQWTATCFGVDARYTLHVTLDDASPGQVPCEFTEPPEPLVGYKLDRRFEAGRHTLRLWLTRQGGDATVTVPGSVLAAGVYELPNPVAIVAGIDVYERELVNLEEWSYVESDESGQGERVLESSHESTGRALVQLLSTDVASDRVRLLVDGVETPAAPVLDGSGYLDALPAGPHTVELQVTGGVPETAQVGVVWRTVAP